MQDPPDKHTLLTKLAEKLCWTVDMTASHELVIDRSLDSSRFRSRTEWAPPSWDTMLEELAAEYSEYA